MDTQPKPEFWGLLPFQFLGPALNSPGSLLWLQSPGRFSCRLAQPGQRRWREAGLGSNQRRAKEARLSHSATGAAALAPLYAMKDGSGIVLKLQRVHCAYHCKSLANQFFMAF